MKLGRWRKSHKCLKCESGSSCFQPGEGPSRGLLRAYEPSDGTFSSTSLNTASSWVPGPGWLHAAMQHTSWRGRALNSSGIFIHRWQECGKCPQTDVVNSIAEKKVASFLSSGIRRRFNEDPEASLSYGVLSLLGSERGSVTARW